VALESRIKR